MPRDVNGNYTLPAGNPVVTATLVSSAWANSTLSDVALGLTNSLDRTGVSGGMTGQFRAIAGNAAGPGFSWVAEATSGIYRNAAGDFRFAITAIDILKFTVAGIRAGVAAQTVSAPAAAVVSTSAGGDAFFSIAGDSAAVFGTSDFSMSQSGSTHIASLINKSNADVIIGTNSTGRFTLTAAGNLVPIADNAYAIGSSSFSVSNVYIGAGHAPATDASGNIYYGARTAAEVAAGVTPTKFAYSAAPHDVRRYGAVMDGVTDDSAAWAALALVIGQGGSGYAPPLPTMIVSQVTINAPSFQRVSLVGYGCELFTTNAISCLKITGGSATGGLSIFGLTVNARGNATQTAGIDIVGSWNTYLYDCTGTAYGTAATWAAFLVRNTTAADPSTGSFWTRLVNCKVRVHAGGDGTIPNGIILQGAANATVISGCVLNAVTCIQLQPESGQTYVANGVVIENTAFEGFTDAINCNGAAASTFSGLRIIGNRAESGTNFFKMTGSTTLPAVPPYLAGNYIISSVTNYIVNTNNLYYTSLDFSVTPNIVVPQITSPTELGLIGTNSANEVLTVYPANVGSGYRLRTQGGTTLGTWHMRSGGGSSLNGATGLYLSGISSISQSATEAKNLRGTATFAAATSVAVSFGVAEADASYFIALGGNLAGFCWVTAKGTGGFTINCSVSNSNTTDWHLIR